jgi:hypothetical protein
MERFVMKLKCLLLATLFCALHFASPTTVGQQAPVADAPVAFEGGWEGEAETDRWPLFLSMRLERSGEKLGGKLFVLGQTVDLTVAQINGDDFTIATGSEPGALVLQGKRQAGSLVGRLKQSGAKDADYPFTFRRIPEYPKPANRLEAWAQDLDALEQRFIKVDRSFSPAARAAFLDATAETRKQLSTLNDAQIIMRIAAAIALANNAHTRLYLLRNRTELRRLPVRLWWFNDGLYVVRTTPEYRKLLGCRVDSIAGLDPRHARDMVAPAFAGNPSWKDYLTVYSLTSPEALHGFGVTPELETARMSFSGCAGGAETVDIKPMPLAKSNAPLEAWWDLSPAHAPSGGAAWVQALQGSKTPTPLYLRDPAHFYWYEYLPQNGIFYFQYNRASDMKEENTKAFATRLLEAFDKQKPKAFVLDLRFNTGGNTDLAHDLMKALQTRTKGIPRFVITGRATFSAGIAHAARWREAGDVNFVGEPVGDVMDFWSEGGNIILPNSGLAAHFANGAHSYSTAPCPQGVKCLDLNVASLKPDIPVLLSWQDYQAGRDPAMAAIVNMLAASR